MSSTQEVPEGLETLCEQCSQISFETLFGALGSEYLQRYVGCLESARSNAPGCSFCTFLVEAYDLAFEDEGVRRGELVGSDDDWYHYCDIWTSAYPLADPNDGRWFELAGLSLAGHETKSPSTWLTFLRRQGEQEKMTGRSLHVTCFQPKEGAGRKTWHESPRQRGEAEIRLSRLNYDMVKSWLQICLQEHPSNCKESSVFVRRMLNIRLIDVNTRTVVRAGSQIVSYIALTYVWGPDMRDVCERFWTSNIGHSTYPSLPLPHHLPQTIEDAIELTGRLGYRYLWVDAFCINQIDELDVQRQISNMHHVYECAQLTIAAMDGSNADAGLCGISRSFQKLTQPTVHLGSVSFRATHIFNMWGMQCQCPWEGRAWTLQELLLSRRVLFLHGEYVMMRCAREIFSELTPWENDTDRVITTQSAEIIWDNGFNIEVDSTQWSFKEFNIYLDNYTNRSLSNENDILFACQGVFNQITRYTGVGFIEGLPVADLHLALLWYPFGETLLKRRVSFPSWSWAGWRGRIGYHSCITDFKMYENDTLLIERAEIIRERKEGERIEPDKCLAATEKKAHIVHETQGNRKQLKIASEVTAVKASKIRIEAKIGSRVHWLLLDRAGRHIPNEIGVFARFEPLTYSFVLDESISELLQEADGSCALVFIKHFPALRDRQGRLLFDYVACLVTMNKLESNTSAVLERIGYVIMSINDWAALHPQVAVVYIE